MDVYPASGREKTSEKNVHMGQNVDVTSESDISRLTVASRYILTLAEWVHQLKFSLVDCFILDVNKYIKHKGSALHVSRNSPIANPCSGGYAKRVRSVGFRFFLDAVSRAWRCMSVELDWWSLC